MKNARLISGCFLSAVVCLLVFSGKAYAQSASDLARKLDRLKAYPDVIVLNGKISTVDPGNREVQAMAVKNNRILSLGTNDEIRFLAGPSTQVIDAKGRRVLPGLIDGHTHPHVWAIEHYLGIEGDATSKRFNDPELKIVFAKGKDKSEVLRSLERLVRQRAQEVGPGKWIWVILFGGDSIVDSRTIVNGLFPRNPFAPADSTPGATLSREYLDTLAPDNPLMVASDEIIGPGANNTKARDEMMKVLGYEAIALSALTRVPYDVIMRGRVDFAADLLRREMLSCLSAQGVTTYGNHYYGTPSIMKAHRYLQDRGELPVRWGWWIGGGISRDSSDASILLANPSQAANYSRSFYQDLGDFRGLGDDYIWNVGVANEGWEFGLICTKAKPSKPLPPGTPPLTNTSDITAGFRPNCDTMKIPYDKQAGYETVKAALEAGLRIGFMHGYSDGTYDALFNMLDQAVSSGELTLEQVRSLRISMEHNPIVRPDQVKTMAKYNMMPAFNGYQVQGNIKGGAFLKDYGENVMTWIAPMKSLVDSGAHPVFNTDAHLFDDPPEAMAMDWPPQWKGNIWAFIEFFVTRRMPHDGITYNRGEAMDRLSMIRSATIWGAEQLLNEKNVGSLEVGKLADFIILNKDFFAIPEDDIHTIKTMLTAVGGKVVYKSESY